MNWNNLLVLGLALCCVVPTQQQVFTTWTAAGVTADPCNGVPASPLCFTYAPPAVTVLFPSPTGLAALPPLTNTLTGTGFSTTMVLALGSGGSCAATTTGTNVAVSATTTSTSLVFTIPTSWQLPIELQGSAVPICWSNTGAVGSFAFSGFWWKVVFSCDPNVANQQCPPPSASAADQVKLAGAYKNPAQPFASLSDAQLALRKAQTVCCSGGARWVTGQCVNSNAEKCCGSTSYAPDNQRCCNSGRQMVQYFDQPCPCWRSSADNDCPRNETCCLQSKFPEITYDTQPGQCYNPVTHQCCNTGQRFDPGTSQCCVINGVQSLNSRCPCGSDDHCVGNWADGSDDAFFLCCNQTWPTLVDSAPTTWTSPLASDPNPTRLTCNIYANYDPLAASPWFLEGQGANAIQPCLGRCFDSRFSQCCNGRVCINNYEQCCNGTCCPKFTATCQHGRRPGVSGSFYNRRGFRDDVLVCTTVEQMNAFKGFWVFVLPTQMLAMMFLGLAFVLGFASHANHHNPRSYIFIERVMIALALLQTLFAVPYFFSPLYKYGSIQVLASLLVILTAAARIRWLNFACIVVQGLFLFYLFDPFHGSAYFNFASGRHIGGTIDSETMGVLHVIDKMWRSRTGRDSQWCVNWYDFFLFDANAQDLDRYDNPAVTTFGYCSRAYIMALYLFTGFTLLFTLIQFITDVVAVIIRFRERYDVHLEVHKE